MKNTEKRKRIIVSHERSEKMSPVNSLPLRKKIGGLGFYWSIADEHARGRARGGKERDRE